MRRAVSRLIPSLLLVAMVAGGVPALAQSAPPAKPGAGKAVKPASKTEEKEGTIVGVAIPRAKGGFLGLSTENGCFKLTFYNAKKNPIAADVARATARWQPQQLPRAERTVLNSGGDGTALFSVTFVQPPRVFRVYLTLFDAPGNAVENYQVDFRE